MMQKVSRQVEGITNSVLSLAARFQGVEEIAYSELSREEKV